jgi:hypothetical protein
LARPVDLGLIVACGVSRNLASNTPMLPFINASCRPSLIASLLPTSTESRRSWIFSAVTAVLHSRRKANFAPSVQKSEGREPIRVLHTFLAGGLKSPGGRGGIGPDRNKLAAMSSADFLRGIALTPRFQKLYRSVFIDWTPLFICVRCKNRNMPPTSLNLL